jgi:hypothetical protein
LASITWIDASSWLAANVLFDSAFRNDASFWLLFLGTMQVGQTEIAVVYYGAGYAPTDYPDGDDGVEWQARLRLEQSRAAKCPSLGYHLAGTKKVQQELARPGVLERFFPKPEEHDMVQQMRYCFAGLYSMGVDATPEDLAATNIDEGVSLPALRPCRVTISVNNK